MKKRTQKAWGVYYGAKLDCDEMHWFNALAYAVFINKEEAVKWIGDSQSAYAEIVPVLISPIKKKKV